MGLALSMLLSGAITNADAESPALKTTKYSTTVTLSSKFPAFSGRVSSSSDPCVKRRRIELYEKVSGGGRKRLGKDMSDASGRWAIELDNVKPGAYYAQAKPKSKRIGGEPLICKTGRSETVTVD